MAQGSSKRRRTARTLSPLYLQPNGRSGLLSRVEGQGMPLADVYYGLLPGLSTIGTVDIEWQLEDYRIGPDRMLLTEGKGVLDKRPVKVATLRMLDAALEDATETHVAAEGWRMAIGPDMSEAELLHWHGVRVGKYLLDAIVLNTNRIWGLYEGELLPSLPVIDKLPGRDE